MLFTTSLLGNVEVDASRIIEFPRPLPGFEHCTRFELFHDADKEAPKILWMQSLDDADVLFSVTDPAFLGLRYEIMLSDEEVELLGLARAEDAIVLVMVFKEARSDSALPSLLSPIKANLRNPLVINLESRIGLQKDNLICDIVLHNRQP